LAHRSGLLFVGAGLLLLRPLGPQTPQEAFASTTSVEAQLDRNEVWQMQTTRMNKFTLFYLALSYQKN